MSLTEKVKQLTPAQESDRNSNSTVGVAQVEYVTLGEKIDGLRLNGSLFCGQQIEVSAYKQTLENYLKDQSMEGSLEASRQRLDVKKVEKEPSPELN
ncbi:unnamed protein product [Bursaphelenchus okinawaensis]|uniref:Uncharacterized protein n=1 Tax=Bursaphelenchus okinawaensis TaxID=465554 RepID=A0A811L1K4_9BILA|nr:unnamed protein product [Bursaphelenchus okinawaensis]CAG9114842.1 unnamed protein product [Bursaphelenchus okinawaensis]